MFSELAEKKVGTFEHRVKKLDDGNGYIDLIWKGVVLVEMKSRSGLQTTTIYKRSQPYGIFV